MFLPCSLVIIQCCGEPPWPRGSVLDLRPLGYEFQIFFLEGSVFSILSRLSRPSLAYMCTKVAWSHIHFILILLVHCLRHWHNIKPTASLRLLVMSNPRTPPPPLVLCSVSITAIYTIHHNKCLKTDKGTTCRSYKLVVSLHFGNACKQWQAGGCRNWRYQSRIRTSVVVLLSL